MSTSIDITSQSRDHIEFDDIDFHPLVRAELQRSLRECQEALENCVGDQLRFVQGKVRVLRWILGLTTDSEGMLKEILVKERAKAKAAEAAAE